MLMGQGIGLALRRRLFKSKLLRNLRDKQNHLATKNCDVLINDKENNSRFNSLNIQMLSSCLHSQIFKSQPQIDPESVARSIEHLKQHQLWEKETSLLPDIELKLPTLHGNNIDEHFQYLGNKFSQGYKELLEKLVNCSLPPKPTKWEFTKGWMRYSNGEFHAIDYPSESALVFDVEVCMKDGPYPTLATAVSSDAWYCWCSERLVQEQQFSWPKGFSEPKHITLADLIPLETNNNYTRQTAKKDWPLKIIVGHNVMFDRSYVKEQYFLQGTKLRFLDTLSLHMCISGLTATQRAMSVAYKAAKKKNADNDDDGELSMMWNDISSLNNLPDVYALYCDGAHMDKSVKEMFIIGNLNDIRENFQELASYCAQDVLATYKILQKLLPLFYSRFPHPVTFAGMLEMGTAYLPLNQNWERYLQEAQTTYDNLQHELKLSLIHLANNACGLSNDERYKKDPWLWDLDWSTQELKLLKKAPKKKAQEMPKDEEKHYFEEEDEEYLLLKEKLQDIYETASRLPKVRPFLPGYPAWYRALCKKPPKGGENNDDWEPGPRLISTQMRCTPKLLRLVWDNFPLHYDKKHGWGYLVPGRYNPEEVYDEEELVAFPLEELLKLYFVDNTDQVPKMSEELERFWQQISSPKDSSKELSKQWELIIGKKKPLWHHGNGPFEDVKINGCWFYRLPHKDGPHKRVGNPLSKDFLAKVADGTLQAYGGGSDAERVLKRSSMISYWKNSHKRIESQMVVWLNKAELPRAVTRSESYDEDNLYGAILPRLITAGTVTRRAVEPTWLTASNAYEDRVGSELKSMIQSPPGYHFVGADVDSQELWIASLIGDAHFSGIHGCTAFGWMTLQGKKNNGTDMHSKTAQSVGISRDHAKILNYGRIYGAGQPFAQQLLMQFNHRLTAEEAKQKAKKIYTETKGIRKVDYDVQEIDGQEMILNNAVKRKLWVGGSESHMFNKLEEIALSTEPRTPVLSCCISRALEPETVDKNFMTSRINWVVQSSAVDYLHLMLICMKWLMEDYGINGRFCISIHDEVRYFVQSEDRYRAALALQITNLLTRAMFCFKLGMNDVPQSVAFFSSVDIDTVVRKEVEMDCKTPSNPHGLEMNYNIPKGEALDIANIIEKTNGGSLKNHS